MVKTTQLEDKGSKKNSRIRQNRKIAIWLLAGTAVILLAWWAFVTFLPFGPSSKPSVSYFVKALDKIGAPKGFTINHDRDDQQGGLLQTSSVRRAYVGQGQADQVRAEMVSRLRTTGFKNVTLQDNSEGGQDVFAGCKGVNIYIRIYQANDDPIDIEVYGGQGGSNSCPNL